eukprot:Platyproteum_vivax@DN5084_c0_g1_i1.p1
MDPDEDIFGGSGFDTTDFFDTAGVLGGETPTAIAEVVAPTGAATTQSSGSPLAAVPDGVPVPPTIVPSSNSDKSNASPPSAPSTSSAGPNGVMPNMAAPNNLAAKVNGEKKEKNEITPYRAWELEHEKVLDQLSKEEEVEKTRRREKAQEDLKKFYEDRAAQIEATKKANLLAEEAQKKEDEEKRDEVDWKRVSELVDLGGAGGGRDIGRMKELLVNLSSKK